MVNIMDQYFFIKFKAITELFESAITHQPEQKALFYIIDFQARYFYIYAK